MLFNSISFLIFLPITFFLYWFVLNKNRKLQNIFLIIASYIFYGWWDWRFLFLIIISSLSDFLLGKMIYYNEQRKFLYLWISIIINIGILGLFKYFNFFITSLQQLLNSIGFEANLIMLNIVLPVGISFYTFQTLSYTLDVYHGKIKPTHSIVSFFAYVSFFPQLVAGPIERARNLLPQFLRVRNFNYEKAVSGVRFIIYGFFKKVVIADNCGEVVNEVFNNYTELNGISIILGVVCFAFQIYGDFSGYSDIAIGTARLFGFDLMMNFKTPYFSRDIAEFWRRWHVSLSSWFRDYVYIPLGGSRCNLGKSIRNVFIIFIVSGFWHGANWTFVIWGVINAFFFIPLMLFKKNRLNTDNVAEKRSYPSFKELVQIFTTFLITCFAWIFFRSDNIGEAFEMINSILIDFNHGSNYITPLIYGLILIFLIFEWPLRKVPFDIWVGSKRRPNRRIIYCALILLIFFFANFGGQEFIYFQF